MSLRFPLAGAALAALTLAGAAQAAGNIVVNPGFESGVLNPWTSSVAGGWIEATGVTGVGADVGTRFAAASAAADCTPAAPCLLSQTLGTAAGQAYDLSFDYNPGEQSFAADLKVFWDGAQVDDIVAGANAWTTFSLTGLKASSGSTVLSFQAVQQLDPSGLDAVSVVAETAGVGGVPEPSTWALMLLGFAGLGSALRASRDRLGPSSI